MTEPGYPVATRFLSDGGQAAEEAAAPIVEFFAEARATLDLAIYDLRLEPPAADALLNAFADAKRRGVRVRLLFNVDHHARTADPPPPQVDWDFLHRLDIPFRPVSGVPDLMHHKYAVRDPGAASGGVLTGSTNWTNDSWTREENVFVAVQSPELASAYSDNFEELWNTRTVAETGLVTAGWTTLLPMGDRIAVRPHFTPGGAGDLVEEIARRVAAAHQRLFVCSPVITDGPILRALTDVVQRNRLQLVGAYDKTQMDEVRVQWAGRPDNSWKIEAFDVLVRGAALGAKASIPYSRGSTHNFMHAKIVVADDCVFTGSYNLSHSGEANAENVLQIENPSLADQFAAYVLAVCERYRPIAVTAAADAN